jgi:hypothetical protein
MVRPEQQGPQLNALPWCRIFVLLIYKCCVWTCSSLAVIVELLEDQHLVWLLCELIMPPVVRAMLKSHRFVDILEDTVAAHDEIRMRDRRGVGNSERVFVDRLDWAPCLVYSISTSLASESKETMKHTFTIIIRPWRSASVSSGKCLCRTLPDCQEDWSRCAANTAGWWLTFFASCSFLKSFIWNVLLVMRVAWLKMNTRGAPVLD